MNEDLRAILARLAQGDIDVDEALARLRRFPIDDLGFARVDTHRALRRGVPEVIFGQSKTPGQIVEIARALERAGQNILCTRVTPEQAAAVQAGMPELVYNSVARTLSRILAPRKAAEGMALVMCAGTSDMPVAEEAAETLAFLGDEVEKAYDVGVAGIHRLFEQRDRIEKASVIVVAAGMEGALPSVVAGMAAAPVIAVPTSVGYGASFGGVTALLAMLNSCSGGVAVVNIDNGFGAALFADLVLRTNQR